MPGKDPKSYDVDEVCLFLNAIGLSSKADAFRDNAVDGDMLVSLTDEDLKGELGLSTLQARKVQQKLEFAKELAEGGEGGGGGGNDEENAAKIQALEEENAALRAQIEELKKQLAALQPKPPAPAPAPAPAPKAAPPPPRKEHHVIKGKVTELENDLPLTRKNLYRSSFSPRALQSSLPSLLYFFLGGDKTGAAKGTARGAVVGAVAGAIAGDPAQGGKNQEKGRGGEPLPRRRFGTRQLILFSKRVSPFINWLTNERTFSFFSSSSYLFFIKRHRNNKQKPKWAPPPEQPEGPWAVSARDAGNG